MPHEPRRLYHPESAPGAAAPEASEPVGAKETVTSLLIAFALAFVFRGYVVEPYVIPTNSMAPTLLGAHIRWVDPANGYDWPTSHFYAQKSDQGLDSIEQPLPQQGGIFNGVNFGPLSAFDPVTRQPVQVPAGLPIRSGDRIFVLRYVEPIFSPRRWDVVVFRTPTPGGQTVSTGAGQAFIKRLVGLPGEEVALFDGDVFTRPNDGAPTPGGKTRWDLPDWKIASKDELPQRAVWQTVFNSRYAPAVSAAGSAFLGPFVAGGPGWEIAGRTAYTYSGNGPTTLQWDSGGDDAIDYDALFLPRDVRTEGFRVRDQARRRWTLTDGYAMDEIFPQPFDRAAAEKAVSGQAHLFPVSDLRLSAGVQAQADGLTVSMVIRTREHEFRGRLAPKGSDYEAVVEMRPVGGDSAWTVLASAASPAALRRGEVVNVEFWHADQQLQLWVDGRRAVSAEYAWTLAERVQHTLGHPTIDLVKPKPGETVSQCFALIQSGKNYCKPKPWFEISGPAVLHRVGIDRDLFYQPIANPGRAFSAGAHPSDDFAKKLTKEQYFTCGDNSPMSSDARAWTDVDPWVRADIDPTPGVVNKRLMVGKAFFVYFPAVQTKEVFGAKVPMVDAGRARWIW